MAPSLWRIELSIVNPVQRAVWHIPDRGVTYTVRTFCFDRGRPGKLSWACRSLTTSCLVDIFPYFNMKKGRESGGRRVRDAQHRQVPVRRDSKA